MYEIVTQSGQKKLKKTAVPTIFTFRPPAKKRKKPLQRTAPTVVSVQLKADVILADHTYIATEGILFLCSQLALYSLLFIYLIDHISCYSFSGFMSSALHSEY